MFLFMCFIAGIFSVTALTPGEEKHLVVVAVLPFSGQFGHIGRSAKSDVDHALLEINSNNSILRGYNLTVEWVDSKCDMAVAIKSLFDKLDEVENVLFVYGGFCSNVTKPIAESISYLQLWQISFANTDPTLSDVSTYRNFLRVIPNELDFNVVWTSSLQAYDWKKVGLLFQDASSDVDIYAYTNNDMISLLKDLEIDYTSESVTDTSTLALDRAIESDTRILIGSFDHVIACRTICLAYHKGMYGYKYVWMLSQSASYPSYWWRQADNCTTEQMEVALQGHFSVDILGAVSSQTQLGKYSIEHSAHRTISLSQRYGGYAYDGIWLMAASLDKFISSQLPGSPNWSTWRNLTQPSFITGQTFSGLTGEVKFDDRRRLGSLLLHQWRDGAYVNVGQLDRNRGDNLTVYKERVFWHGHQVPPLDSMIIEDKIVEPNIVIHVSLMVLATLGLILTALFLTINIKFAHNRYIKMSSPKMNNIILVGCIFIYSSIYILRLNPSAVPASLLRTVCIARSWVLSLGFSLAFGPLFAKTWRVYSIFNSPHRQKKLITDGVLAAVVGALLIIDLIILITWTTVDPLELHISSLTPIEEENKLILTKVFRCESGRKHVWAASIYVYKGILLVVGCFFAWQTRHVNIPALNDSKYIGLSVYNVVIMCTSAVAISYVINTQQDFCDLITGLLTILCTTITLCLVFVPKIMHLRKDPKSVQARPRLSSSHRSVSRRSMLPRQLSAEELNATEIKLAVLEQEVVANQSKLDKVIEELRQLTMSQKANAKRTQTLLSGHYFPLETLTIIENFKATAKECPKESS